MEEAPENGKESSHSAHANGTNERTSGTYSNREDSKGHGPFRLQP